MVNNIVIAYLIVIKTKNKSSAISTTDNPQPTHNDSLLVSWVEKTVTVTTSYKPIVLAATVVITAISIFFAFNLKPTFDVKDFFDPKSDMVIGLDKVDEHVGEKGGEPGIAYIKGDLMDPEAVSAISQFIESLRNVDNIAERPSGEITIGLDVVNTSKIIMDNP